MEGNEKEGIKYVMAMIYWPPPLSYIHPQGLKIFQGCSHTNHEKYLPIASTAMGKGGGGLTITTLFHICDQNIHLNAYMYKNVTGSETFRGFLAGEGWHKLKPREKMGGVGW